MSFALLTALVISGCYTFKGYSISDEIETFYVSNFKVNAPLAPPTINQTFQEALKLKVLRESQLKFVDRDPDIIFDGSISGYDIRAVSPEPGERTALNRLEIRISVEYTDNSNVENNWKNQFSFFQDFPSTQNLLEVQDELIEEIFDQLLEDIFNKAFTNW
jgi:hypothetical protein